MNTDTILNQYLETALWSEDIDGLSIIDIAKESVIEAKKQVEHFINKAANLLNGWDDEQIGHDLWLTTLSHGTGFWDRNLPNGEALTEICHTMEFYGNVFVQGGKVFFEGFPTLKS